MLRAATFVLDFLPGRYEGWTRRQTWNGFACPYFEERVMRRLLQDLIASGDAGAVLDEVTGEVTVFDADHPGEPERFGPGLAQTDGREVKLWAIGAMTWAWREAPDDCSS